MSGSCRSRPCSAPDWSHDFAVRCCAANVAVTVTGIVAVIAFHADVDNKLSAASALTAGG
jgi:hypothetical protein